MAETEVKKRKVTSKDYDRIQTYILEQLASRESSKARKKHSTIWKSVDDQIAMVPPKTAIKSGDARDDYHAAIQLGALADALEIIAADVLRFAFPIDRKWFVAHSEIPQEIDEEGNQIFDVKKQGIVDGVIRSLMVQQQHDFGFRDRVKASIKEGLSHGGIVAECRMENLTKHIRGGGIQTIKAPVWVPHSMWNCFPDPSPSALGMDLFYRGSMIIRSYMPRAAFMRMNNYIRKDKVPKQKANPKDDATDDIELVTYYGDLSIDRADGDMFLPNYKIVLANEVLVYAKQNEIPYSPIIYTGYEKDDIRDPYYTSPLIKRAPTHKLATELVNRYIDGAERLIDPPGFYDSYDSQLVADGGPKTYPGAMTGLKGGSAAVKFMDIGDPTPIFNCAQILLSDIKEGTSVDSSRAGVSTSGDVTATEVRNNSARGEVRTVDFLGVLDRQGLQPFLHMQHDYNKLHLENYPFFNNQLDTPDFLRMSKGQIPDNIIFEVVGSKQVLGDEQRAQKFIASVQLASQIQPVAEMTDWKEVTQEIWNFSGEKDAERFIRNDDANKIDPAQIAEMQQAMQEMQVALQESAQTVKLHDIEKATLDNKIQGLIQEMKIMEEQQQATSILVRHKNEIDRELDKINIETERAKHNKTALIEADKISLERERIDLERDKTLINAALEVMQATASGDEKNVENAEEKIKSLQIEGLDKIVASLKEMGSKDGVEKLIKEMGKPRTVVRDKDKNITGLE